MLHYRPRASNLGPILYKVAKFGFQLLQLVRLRFALARHRWENCFLHVTKTHCSIQNPAHVFLSRSIICGVTPIHAISFDFSLLENAADSHKRHQNFSHPTHQSFFNVSPRVFCRRVITSACSFLLYVAQPVHPPFTLPSTCFTHSIQQFSTTHNVFGLQVTASPHPLVGTARFQEKKHEAQDLIRSTSRTEIRGNYGISDSLGWQSHFLRAEIEPMETCEMMIEDCGCENFQKGFCKLERGML